MYSKMFVKQCVFPILLGTQQQPSNLDMLTCIMWYFCILRLHSQSNCSVMPQLKLKLHFCQPFMNTYFTPEFKLVLFPDPCINCCIFQGLKTVFMILLCVSVDNNILISFRTSRMPHFPHHCTACCSSMPVFTSLICLTPTHPPLYQHLI